MGKVWKARLYRRIAMWAKARWHEAWMANNKHDRKCGCCGEWYGWTRSWMNARVIDDCNTEVTCSQCGAITQWCETTFLPVISQVRTAHTNQEEGQ